VRFNPEACGSICSLKINKCYPLFGWPDHEEEFNESKALAETHAEAAEKIMMQVSGSRRPDAASSPTISSAKTVEDPAPEDLQVRDSLIWDTADNAIIAKIRELRFNPFPSAA
jgi:hypothetical protein